MGLCLYNSYSALSLCALTDIELTSQTVVIQLLTVLRSYKRRADIPECAYTTSKEFYAGFDVKKNT